MFPGCPEHWNAEGTLSEYSQNIACLLGNDRGGVLLLVYFEGYHSVASYQQHLLWNIAVSHSYFSLPMYNLTKFNTPSHVLFTWSHLKHRFLKNFCIILFVSEKGLYATFLVSYCWYHSYMSSYFILIEHVVFFSPPWEKRWMVSIFFVLLLIKGKYFAKG